MHDAQCAAGQLCVAMTSHSTAIGNFCAWRKDADGSGAPNGDCLNVAPYLNEMTATTSVDGTMATVCVPAVSSCPALMQFRTGGAGGAQCTGPTTGTGADMDCGACTPLGTVCSSASATDVPDGFCRVDNASHHFCTVECTNTNDCPCTGGTCTAHYACNGGFCALN
jgi:hypothetical protein